jgi:hypothetical protein
LGIFPLVSKFGGSDSVRRVREAQGLSAAPFSFSSDVPQLKTLPYRQKRQHLAGSELIASFGYEKA